jgi:hypothetical protein
MLFGDLVPKNKKREKAPAGKAQFVTRLMVVEGFLWVKRKSFEYCMVHGELLAWERPFHWAPRPR